MHILLLRLPFCPNDPGTAFASASNEAVIPLPVRSEGEGYEAEDKEVSARCGEVLPVALSASGCPFYDHLHVVFSCAFPEQALLVYEKDPLRHL